MLKRTTIGLLASLALGVAGLYLVVGGAVFDPATYRVHAPSPSLLILAAACLLGKWFSPAARIGLLCRGQGVSLPFHSTLLAHLCAMFVAGFTPNNMGVGLATVAALGRLGVPLGRGIGVAVQIFVLDLLFFAWAVPVGIAYLAYSGTLGLPPDTGAAALAIAAAAIVGATVLGRRPRLVVRLLLSLARWPLLGRFAPRLRRAARDYYRSARAFSRMPPSQRLSLHLVTAATWFSSFVLLWALFGLYGAEVGLLVTLAVLSSLTLVSHFVPTPGAAGFMEAAVGFSLGGVAAALLLWRLATFYAIFLIGPLAVWLLYRSSPKPGRAKVRPSGPKGGRSGTLPP